MKPRINEPCPMHISSLTSPNGSLSCNSCKNKVIDFRNKSDYEIKQHFAKSRCGIFYEDQLEYVPKFKTWRNLLFKGLIIASLLGFSVKPMLAQTEHIVKDKRGNKVCLKTKDKTSFLLEKKESKKTKKEDHWTPPVPLKIGRKVEVFR